MKTTFSILGIHCNSCAMLIKDVSSEFPAIKLADVDIDHKTVTIEYDESLDLSAWKTGIEGLGEPYKVIAQ